jgi:hypothetical protein
MKLPITREHLQYGLGALAALAVIGVYVVRHTCDLGMAGFAIALLGVAGWNDFKNSPPLPSVTMTGTLKP